jgi:DNA polymerase III epsilon subunit-like protein
MDWASSYLVFDFETTGLSPKTDHIIQVGLCEVVDGRVSGHPVALSTHCA